MTTATRATILNADDTEASRDTKSRTLRHAGFDVIEARTGREAIERMAESTPALVLLDVGLPDISGIEVCQTIKSRWPTTLVLQSSATYTSAADRTMGLEGGADAYMIQPIDPDELVASVRALLRLHAAEERARQLNETLERRIEERTDDLRQANARLVEQIAQRERAETALVQAQKMEAVGQLTGSMAHDFNNILASMTGYIHLVRRKSQDAALHQLLDKALQASERGKRLTGRLLAFARSDTLVTGPVDVCTLLLGMREWLQQTVGSGVALELRASDGDCIAVTDANQLELAVLNLAINARDAMPGGGAMTIDVAARELAAPDVDLGAGRYVVIGATDTGGGMAPEIAAKAFDPFFTTKPVGRGTGLGLAQVQNLCRLSDGSARVESTPGRGTRVSLWLAASDADAEAPLGPASNSELMGLGERILVVDDEADILRTVSDLLADSGYEVVCAASGAEALAVAERESVDLVLLDFAMPGMNGLEVARALRERAPELPIVFVSGHAERDLLEAAVHGARLLRKPFRSEELTREIRQRLREARARARR